MRAKQNAAQDPAPGIKVIAPWRVIKVIALSQFRLEVTFVDGLHGYVDMSRKVSNKEAGVFGRLKDTSIFNKVYVEYGVVTWPGELDLAPDAMYDEIKQRGEWVLD
jgi:hypothetical protein